MPVARHGPEVAAGHLAVATRALLAYPDSDRLLAAAVECLELQTALNDLDVLPAPTMQMAPAEALAAAAAALHSCGDSQLELLVPDLIRLSTVVAIR